MHIYPTNNMYGMINFTTNRIKLIDGIWSQDIGYPERDSYLKQAQGGISIKTIILQEFFSLKTMK